MSLLQKEITLPALPRGIHNITGAVRDFLNGHTESGLLHVFLRHTSAALTVNENADPSVLRDMDDFLDSLAPDSKRYLHDDEGPDDMPAHIKSSVFGCSLTLPVTKGRLNLGTWQGIYLCEFRNRAGRRTIVLTLLSA